MGQSEKLVPSFEVNPWASMDDTERLGIKLRAMDDPIFFWEHPALGGLPYTTWKDVDQRRALKDLPKDQIHNNTCQLKLFPKQKEIISNFCKRDEVGKRLYDEMFFIGGRGATKSTISSMLAVHEAFRWSNMKNPQKHYNLLPGTDVKISYVANKEETVRETMFDTTKSLICGSPFLMDLNIRFVKQELEFPNKLNINYHGSNSLSLVGRNVKMMVFDEASNLDQETASTRSAQSIYDNLEPSVNRFDNNEGIRICQSAIRHSKDFMMQNYNRVLDLPKDNPSTIVYNINTYDLNPKTDTWIEKERARNPLRFAQMYENETGLDIERFFNPDIMKFIRERNQEHVNVFNEDYTVKPFKPNPSALFYMWGLDPAATGDNFGISLGYVTSDHRIVIIGSIKFEKGKEKMINYANIEKLIDKVHMYVRPKYALFDIYLAMYFVPVFSKVGTNVLTHILNRPDWLYFKDGLTEDRAKILLPNYEFLFEEMDNLIDIRQTKVDHDKNTTKDVTDSACQIASFIRRMQEEKLKNSMKKITKPVYRGRTSLNGKYLN